MTNVTMNHNLIDILNTNDFNITTVTVTGSSMITSGYIVVVRRLVSETGVANMKYVNDFDLSNCTNVGALRL